MTPIGLYASVNLAIIGSDNGLILLFGAKPLSESIALKSDLAQSTSVTLPHYSEVTMSAITSQITDVSIVCLIVSSGAYQKKTSKLRATGFCEGNLQVTGEFPSPRASNAENIPI